MNSHTPGTNRLPRLAGAVLLILGAIGTTTAGIQGSGFRSLAAIGIITSTGDITVNGTTYSSKHARVSVNGRVSDLSHLQVGQVVTIEGSIDAGSAAAVANDISYVADLRGTVSSMNAEGRTFSVLGYTVRLSDTTVVEGQSSAEIDAGSVVEVSGYPNAANELVASRVAIQSPDVTPQVRGTIAALDRRAHTFMLGTLLVDYDSATVEGALDEGVAVIVQGGDLAAQNVLGADGVAVAPPLGAPGEKGDVESIITSFASAADFELGGLRILSDERTHYVLHGGALGPNATVRVKGRFSDDEALIADKVELMKHQGAAQVKAKKPKAKEKP